MARPIRWPTETAAKILTDGIPFGPRTHPCVCGAGRHAHAGQKREGSCKETRCARYRPDTAYELAYHALDAEQATLGQVLRRADARRREAHRKANPVPEGHWRIGASDTDTCRRQIWYRNKRPEAGTDWSDNREATVGTVIHEGVEQRMRALYPWRRYEFTVTIPGLDREHRVDWFDPVTGQVGDTKTVGRYRWDVVEANGPSEAAWGQVLLYGLALDEAGETVHTVRLDYLHREKGHDLPPFVRPYDRGAAIAVRDRLIGYATSLDLDLDPDEAFPRDGEGPARDEICRRCPFRSDCWQIDKATDAGRSPVSWVYLGPSPEDEEVTWVIEQHIAAAAAKRAAEKRVAEVKDLLDGIEPRRYGDVQGKFTGGGKAPDWKSYAERLLALYALPDGERPPLDEIPDPPPQRYTYVRWSRVPKATLVKEARQANAPRIGEEKQ